VLTKLGTIHCTDSYKRGGYININNIECNILEIYGQYN
jgi:hypothetical protein